MNKKIAIYGWAFNPPTLWHKYVIKEILEKSSTIGKIILVPDGMREDKKYGISMEDKLVLAKHFHQDLVNEGLNVSLDTHFLEWKNGGNTNTVEVDKHFTKKYWSSLPHIFWSDVIDEIKGWVWNENSYIEETLKKIIIHRKWYDFDKQKVKNYEFIPGQPLSISSTMVREGIKITKKVEHLLIPEVAEYIERRKLYK